MYLNEHVENAVRTVPNLGCNSCNGSLGCGDCPFKKKNPDLGFDASSFASAGTSVIGTAANFALPGAGPIIGGIGSFFSSLFGGGMSKEQKQAGPYYQEALSGLAKDAYFPSTQAELLEFMTFIATPPTKPVNPKFPDVPEICGTKWCPGLKSGCSGAGARGCGFILPYQVYKQVGGPYTTQNPAYATFGGGVEMMEYQIIPYFRKLLAQYQSTAGGTVSAVASEVTGAVGNYWPLLLIGGLLYLGKGRRMQ